MKALHVFDSASPWTEKRLSKVKKHNGVAVSFYIRGTPGGFRHATKADVALARRMGLGAIPNAEWTFDHFRTCSIADARANGVEAKQAAQACGFPDDGSITLPFSFDYELAKSGFTRALDQLNAC